MDIMAVSTRMLDSVAALSSSGNFSGFLRGDCFVLGG